MLAWLKYYTERRTIPNCSRYEITRSGDFYRDGIRVEPFNSSGYLQVYIRTDDGKRFIQGVHQLVSMVFDPNWFPGCVVHHRDENKHNNFIYNLKVETSEEHTRHHANPEHLIAYTRKNGPVNKGKKMSPEFCEKCRISAIKRAQREREENIKHNRSRTYSNQFRNADGTKKRSE